MGHKSIVVMKAMAAAYVVTILLLLLVAFIMYKTHLGDNYSLMLISATYVLSNLAGGWICAKAMNSRRLVWGVITAAAYFVLLYLISLIVGGREAKEMLDVVRMAGCCLAGGVLGGILS